MTDPFAVLQATWPPAEIHKIGAVTFRDGQGGGKRVSASSFQGELEPRQISAAEAEMMRRGQPLLFSVRSNQPKTDTILVKNGYELVDETVLMQCELEQLTQIPVPPVTCFPIWEPLQIMKDIWSAGGICDDRMNVMKRVVGPKTAILGRINDHPGGTCFVAVHDVTAMVHALEVLPHQRRSGMGAHMMRAAGLWANKQGAKDMMLAVTRANIAALALYSELGMREIDGYHYRFKPDESSFL